MSSLKRISVVYAGIPGLPGTNTIYAHEDGVSTADQVAAVAAFFTGFAGQLNAALSLEVNGVVEIVDSTSGAVTGTDSTGTTVTINGSNSSPLLPYTSQLLVQWRTDTFFGGRELRGRIFLPGFTTDANNDGKVAVGTLGSIQGHVDTLVSDANLAVYSPTKRQWASVSRGQVWSEFAVLRSRRD